MFARLDDVICALANVFLAWLVPLHIATDAYRAIYALEAFQMAAQVRAKHGEFNLSGGDAAGPEWPFAAELELLIAAESELSVAAESELPFAAELPIAAESELPIEDV